jgi:uncharacterized protein (DUF2141 family)
MNTYPIRPLSVWALILSTGMAVSAEPENALSIGVSGLRSQQGTVNLALFDQAKNFPSDPQSAVQRWSLPVQGSATQVSVPDLAPGEYAVAVFHDENGNQVLDRNWLGIPKEGVGFSNNPPISGGPPEFAAARFRVGPEATHIGIQIHY